MSDVYKFELTFRIYRYFIRLPLNQLHIVLSMSETVYFALKNRCEKHCFILISVQKYGDYLAIISRNTV